MITTGLPSLGRYRILRSEGNFTLMRIYVEPLERPQSCLCCAGVRLRSKGRYERRVRHLEYLGARTELVISCRRFRCVECGGTFVQPLPGVMAGRHSTEPYRARIYEHHDDGVCATTIA